MDAWCGQEMIGTPLTLVEMNGGQFWNRHIDHIRECALSPERVSEDTEDPLAFPSPTSHNSTTTPNMEPQEEQEDHVPLISKILQSADTILLNDGSRQRDSCSLNIWCRPNVTDPSYITFVFL